MPLKSTVRMLIVLNVLLTADICTARAHSNEISLEKETLYVMCKCHHVGMWWQEGPQAHRGFMRRARAVDIQSLYRHASRKGLRLILCGEEMAPQFPAAKNVIFLNSENL